MATIDEPDFYVVMHMGGDDNTFGAGPFKAKEEADKYKTSIDEGRKKCQHPSAVVPMWYGPHQIILTAYVLDLDDMVPGMKDHMN